MNHKFLYLEVHSQYAFLVPQRIIRHLYCSGTTQTPNVVLCNTVKFLRRICYFIKDEILCRKQKQWSRFLNQGPALAQITSTMIFENVCRISNNFLLTQPNFSKLLRNIYFIRYFMAVTRAESNPFNRFSPGQHRNSSRHFNAMSNCILDLFSLKFCTTDKMSSCFELHSIQIQDGCLFLSFPRQSAVYYVNSYRTAFTLSTLLFHLVSVKGFTEIFAFSFSTFYLSDERERSRHFIRCCYITEH